MPDMVPIAVADLSLDLRNYRTVRQSSEISAIEAMVSTSPDRFWALTESLVKDGYLPTESIIVLRTGRDNSVLTVREGNRRIGALKLIHGFLPPGTIDVPDSIAAQIKGLPAQWRHENTTVPCTVYGASDAATVDRIVTLAHGKGEKAGRDQWNAVARARHNRDAGNGGEPALDLLERYLEHGRNLSDQQKARWAGDYPLSVLAEALKRLAPRLGETSSPALAKRYPAVKNRNALEGILHDIGQERLGFDGIRRKDVDFAAAYGVPPLKGKSQESSSKAKNGGAKTGGTQSSQSKKSKPKDQLKALAIEDPRAVRRLLKDFSPTGKRREKVVTLRNEAIRLDVAKTPLAFCFVLRSMLEISAKVYCTTHASSGGPSTTKANGQDKPLVQVLRDITNHLTKNKADKEMVKALHGAMTELGKAEGLLSVTSMNQLVHNPRFSIAPRDVATLFGNVFPLLEAMNN